MLHMLKRFSEGREGVKERERERKMFFLFISIHVLKGKIAIKILNQIYIYG